MFDTSALFKILLKSPQCIVELAKFCDREECWVSRGSVDEMVNEVVEKMVNWMFGKAKGDSGMEKFKRLCINAITNSVQFLLVARVGEGEAPRDEISEDIERKLRLRDENDLHLLRLAFEKSPCTLVSDDKDLLDLSDELKRKGIEVKTTDEFLRRVCRGTD
ncbi:hypothetical protein EYM_00980 [Ignicoccus islandicus DSM 13165]|uniref:PIN domain-containing protein n=1 Tax=Ignicoccus islandicus DSM 13165 TaxID=940295 RepID=A0A0U2VDN1_9CREN|nr:hypothetical protein [Ignicoccus islandicus]ALU12162.1 hypothetical protein EYM_00980 [Ignicoccus islandicus DSM 13165]